MLKLKGIVPPMITPFNQDGELDSRNFEGLLQFLKDKVDGLYICGSYGSGPLMSVAERKKVAEIAVKVIGGKIPIICHTGTTNTQYPRHGGTYQARGTDWLLRRSRGRSLLLSL